MTDAAVIAPMPDVTAKLPNMGAYLLVLPRWTIVVIVSGFIFVLLVLIMRHHRGRKEKQWPHNKQWNEQSEITNQRAPKNTGMQLPTGPSPLTGTRLPTRPLPLTGTQLPTGPLPVATTPTP